MTADTQAQDLAHQLRLELNEAAPQGFYFHDQVVRQDAALGRLVERLASEPPPELGAALSTALLAERDGWVLLKLLELTERLTVTETAPALMTLLERGVGEDPRGRFVVGRASEVLLKLPLDYATRLKANELSKGPLEDVARYRMGAQKERAMHRPRRVEWVLLAVMMVIALVGFVVAWRAL